MDEQEREEATVLFENERWQVTPEGLVRVLDADGYYEYPIGLDQLAEDWWIDHVWFRKAWPHRERFVEAFYVARKLLGIGDHGRSAAVWLPRMELMPKREAMEPTSGRGLTLAEVDIEAYRRAKDALPKTLVWVDEASAECLLERNPDLAYRLGDWTTPRIDAGTEA